MIAALILAGGPNLHSQNFQNHVPRQFILVDDLPLFVYTLTTFQQHPEIDEIYFVCLDGWQAMAESYCRQLNIGKLKKVVTGGSSGQDSAYHGLSALRETCKDDDTVVVHDAIRPLVTDELISDSIRICKEKGMGVAAVGSMDAFIRTEDAKTGREFIDRSQLVRIQTPQSYRFGDLQKYFAQAEQRGVRNHIDVCTMVSALGYDISLSMGSEYNLKINRVEDIGLFKVLKDQSRFK